MSGASDIPNQELRRQRAEESLWNVLATLYRRRILLIVGAFLIGVASIVISLVLPKWYLGRATVIMPISSSRADLGVMLGDLGPAAAGFLLGDSGDYLRLQTILKSRSLREDVVERFDLIEVYGLSGSDTPLEETLEALDANMSVTHDIEYDYLVISVLDRDPQRAADMTNYLVDELNEINARLLTGQAARNRRFLEERYRRIETELDSARARLQRFQEQYGVVELEAQTEAFLNMVADYRSEALLAEVEYDTRRLAYGDENPLVQSARNRIVAARRKERELRTGSDALLPIGFDTLPERLQEFAALKQEALIRANMLELVRPLLEQARFEEIRATPAVQVLDRATPPTEKAKPRRSLLVIGLTFVGCLLLLLGVLLTDWWTRNGSVVRARLRE